MLIAILLCFLSFFLQRSYYLRGLLAGNAFLILRAYNVIPIRFSAGAAVNRLAFFFKRFGECCNDKLVKISPIGDFYRLQFSVLSVPADIELDHSLQQNKSNIEKLPERTVKLLGCTEEVNADK
jgi:hypothetical protein